MKQKNNKGITLIALIITIIVLVILAVVAIREVNGEGIITKALEAKKKSQDAILYETACLEYQNMLIEYKGDIQDYDKATKELQDYLNGKNLEGDRVTIVKGIGVVVDGYNSNGTEKNFKLADISREDNDTKEQKINEWYDKNSNSITKAKAVWLGDSLMRGVEATNYIGIGEYYHNSSENLWDLNKIATYGGLSLAVGGAFINIDTTAVANNKPNTLQNQVSLIKEVYTNNLSFWTNLDIVVLDGGANDIIGYFDGENEKKKPIVTATDNYKTSVIDDFKTTINDLKEFLNKVNPNCKILYLQPFDSNKEHIIEIWWSRGKEYITVDKLKEKLTVDKGTNIDDYKNALATAILNGEITSSDSDTYFANAAEVLNKYIQRLNDLFPQIKEVCQSNNIEYFDLTPFIEAYNGSDKFYQEDKLHFTNIAYTYINKVVTKKIYEMVPNPRIMPKTGIWLGDVYMCGSTEKYGFAEKYSGVSSRLTENYANSGFTFNKSNTQTFADGFGTNRNKNIEQMVQLIEKYIENSMNVSGVNMVVLSAGIYDVFGPVINRTDLTKAIMGEGDTVQTDIKSTFAEIINNLKPKLKENAKIIYIQSLDTSEEHITDVWWNAFKYSNTWITIENYKEYFGETANSITSVDDERLKELVINDVKTKGDNSYFKSLKETQQRAVDFVNAIKEASSEYGIEYIDVSDKLKGTNEYYGEDGVTLNSEGYDYLNPYITSSINSLFK